MRSAVCLIFAAAALCAAPSQGLWQPYYAFPRSGASHVDLSQDWQLGWLDQQATAVGNGDRLDEEARRQRRAVGAAAG